MAIPVAPSPADSTEHRKQLCERYGFRQIGEPLPDNVPLKDIIETLPKKVILADVQKFLIALEIFMKMLLVLWTTNSFTKFCLV